MEALLRATAEESQVEVGMAMRCHLWQSSSSVVVVVVIVVDVLKFGFAGFPAEASVAMARAMAL